MKQLIIVSIMSVFLVNALAVEINHHHENHSLSLNNGKKWVVDQVVKENMDAIQARFMKSKDAVELSKVISESTQKIVSNCKLEPKADQAFHVILADLFVVASELKDQKKVRLATEKLTRTLTTYSKYFTVGTP